MQSTAWETLGWFKHKLESRLPGEISITSDMQVTSPYGRKQRTNSLLMKVKEKSRKVGLKLNSQKTKIMASGLISSVQFSSVAQSCPTLCNPMGCSIPGLPVHHQLPEFTQTHTHWVGDAVFNLSQHHGLFKWVSSSHQVAKVLEFQFQPQSFQWVFRTDFI